MSGFARLFVCFSLLALAACGPAKPDASATPPVSPYAAIANGKVDVEGGVIEVAARRAGVVQDVLVQEGDEVVKDQVLARQESDQPRLAIERAQAALNEAVTAKRLTQVRLDSARREYRRYEELAKSNFIAAQKLDTQRDAIREAEATLASQDAAIASARAALAQSQYDLELTLVRAPVDGRIVRRYANPGSGASTLNVSTMFDLEPKTERIIRSEIVESSIPDVSIGQEAEITPETDPSKVYVGTVKRVAATFGARKLKSDSASEAADERVVEVVVTADNVPFLIGQRVLVKFMKPGEKAGAKPAAPATAAKSEAQPG